LHDKLKVIIAGGGTGGHLYPAISLVKEIENRYPAAEILFFGTAHGIEHKILPEMGYRLRLIWLQGFQRQLSLQNLLIPFQVFTSFAQCMISIIKFKPDVVIGTGGYVSAPVLFSAALLGYPTLIQEQNSFPGVTTRLLAKVVDQVHLSFEDSLKFFKQKDNVFISGNPIRSSLKQMRRSDALLQLDLDGSRKNLLIFGGSQGAHSINMAMIKVLDHVLNNKDWQIIWGSGERDDTIVQQACQRFGKRILHKPYFSDMAAVYAVSDLVVSRGGASTLAELQVCGLPSILVPYPFATAGHQEANVRALVHKNAARMVLNHELESDTFLQTLLTLMGNEKLRNELGANLKTLARPNAAADIIDNMVKLINDSSQNK